jgi:hypothetical protein
VHAAQTPPLQYLLTPQPVPFGALPAAEHCAVPVEHEIADA